MSSTLRYAVWLAGLSALLVAPLAHANEPQFLGDFDGDGHGDRVTFTSQDPSVVHVWLSATGTTNVIRSSEPLLAVAAVDLDGDRRAELLASKRSSGLHIWTNKLKGFRAFRPTHAPLPVRFTPSDHRAIDPGPTPPVVATAVFGSVLPWLVLNVHSRAPTFSAGRHAPCLARGPTSSLCLTPFAPRPPPLSAI